MEIKYNRFTGEWMILFKDKMISSHKTELVAEMFRDNYLKLIEVYEE